MLISLVFGTVECFSCFQCNTISVIYIPVCLLLQRYLSVLTVENNQKVYIYTNMYNVYFYLTGGYIRVLRTVFGTYMPYAVF